MNLMDTLSGSLLEGFFPAGWDLAKMDACIWHARNRARTPERLERCVSARSLQFARRF